MAEKKQKKIYVYLGCSSVWCMKPCYFVTWRMSLSERTDEIQYVLAFNQILKYDRRLEF